MNLLAIETATETCSVALSINGELRERYQHAPRQHAELLLPWVQSLLAEAEIGIGSLDVIAFSRGPGSFTSLRMGIGVVQGLAWAAGVPVVPVSSLAATAQSAISQIAPSASVRRALVALDARMNEVFAGIFELNDDGIMTAAGEEMVCAPGEILTLADADTWGIGIGFERYPVLAGLREQLAGVKTGVWPRASSVLELAQWWMQTNKPLTAELAQPVYLRNDVAKKSVSQHPANKDPANKDNE